MAACSNERMASIAWVFWRNPFELRRFAFNGAA